MCEERCPAELFGQQGAATCTVACTRYLLHHFLRIDRAEADLCRYLEPFAASERAHDPTYDPSRDGFTDEALARFWESRGFRPRFRQLLVETYWEHPLGLDVVVGPLEELLAWLKDSVARNVPVQVALHVASYLGTEAHPDPPDEISAHAVVVVAMTEELVTVFDPGFPACPPPHTGEYRILRLDDFAVAWREALGLAMTVEPPGG